MTRRVDFNDWQRKREAMAATQTEILARFESSADGAPAECRPLHSHKPRSDEEWAALAEGVRALLAERERSGRWRWVGPRRVIIE
jgi:hypothetical protein